MVSVEGEAGRPPTQRAPTPAQPVALPPHQMASSELDDISAPRPIREEGQRRPPAQGARSPARPRPRCRIRGWCRRRHGRRPPPTPSFRSASGGGCVGLPADRCCGRRRLTWRRSSRVPIDRSDASTIRSPHAPGPDVTPWPRRFATIGRTISGGPCTTAAGEHGGPAIAGVSGAVPWARDTGATPSRMPAPIRSRRKRRRPGRVVGGRRVPGERDKCGPSSFFSHGVRRARFVIFCAELREQVPNRRRSPPRVQGPAEPRLSLIRDGKRVPELAILRPFLPPPSLPVNAAFHRS